MGTDVAGAALDYAASRGVPVQRGGFLEIDFAGRLFDAITFWAVLEHLADPAGFLRRAATLLKPGGHVFALVPNMKSLATRLLGTRYRYVCAEHLNYFTVATLLQLANESGPFDLAEMQSTHLNPVVIWQDFRNRGRAATDAERAQLLCRTTSWKQNRLLGSARLAYSWAEKILGFFHLADNLAVVLRKADTKHDAGI
jgi:SAM-dependent methyltransferase